MDGELQQAPDTYRFGEVSIPLVAHDGDVWMTGEAIGAALEYPDPPRGVAKVFQRNREELDPHTCVVNLTTQVEGGVSQRRAVRVYNEEGVMILTMLSRQPKAAAFRAWAVQVLKAYRRGELALAAGAGRDTLLELCIRESGRGNVTAMHTLVRRYGYPAELPGQQLAAMRAVKHPQLPLPVV